MNRKQILKQALIAFICKLNYTDKGLCSYFYNMGHMKIHELEILFPEISIYKPINNDRIITTNYWWANTIQKDKSLTNPLNREQRIKILKQLYCSIK
jgi:hypothetical protein